MTKKIDNRIWELSREILNDLILNESKFDQVGIDNGLEIIKDYLDNNERGLAFQHLQYIIDEMELDIKEHQKESYESIMSSLGQ